MSIGSVLSIARGAMSARQIAIQTASQNIANAGVEGYSKQRVDVAASHPILMPYGSVGTGVTVTGIRRSRDALLDATYRTDSGTASGYKATSDALAEIDSVYGEPSDTGLSSALDQFWASWSDLATNPSSQAPRSVVLARGNQVVQKLNDFANRLDDISQRSLERLRSDVATVNQLTSQIAGLNPQIVSAESSGSPANDLRDQRDRALDQLAKLVGATSIERSNGSVGVYISGRLAVDGDAAKTIDIQGSAAPTLIFHGTTTTIDGVSGTVGAEIDTITKRVPGAMANLDAMAKGIVETVNGIHSAGLVYTGTPPVAAPAGNFFEVSAAPPVTGDPLKTARGIRLASTLTGPDAIAASGAGATGPGNNDVATALAGVRDKLVTFTSPDGTTNLGTMTVGNFYRSAVSSLASEASDASDSATAYETMASNSDARRQSVAGVSTDEELIDLIQHQHAYQAAARLVTVIDQMADTLINLGR